MSTIIQNVSVSQIMFDEETLTLGWDGDRLASKEEYMNASRDVGSIFEALEPGEEIQLQEGFFKLDENLDLASLH